MAEKVQKRSEDLIPVLAEMERIQIFDKSETTDIKKKIIAHEYKIQRTIKNKEDYLNYIKYLLGLLKLIKVRRNKFGNKEKLSVIDYKVSDKVNSLYQETIFTFQDDIRFWMAYIQFCKHAKYKSSVPRMITRMLQVHQDKPKCWLVAAMWEKEENNNPTTAEEYLLKGLHFHPESALLLTNIFKLTLEVAEQKRKKDEKDKDPKHDAVLEHMKKTEVVYKHVFTKIKDPKIIIELLNVAKGYQHTEELQQQMLTDLLQEFEDQPIVWDTMARRELEGNLPRPLFYESSIETESTEKNSLKNRISLCNEVYQTAVKKINNEEIWSLYLDCLLEINMDTETLPNFKKKLLKNALMQGYQAEKLTEKYCLHWINMMSSDTTDESSQKKIYDLLTMATETLPNSVNLWNARLKYLLSINDENAADVFKKAIKILGKNSLPLWKTNLSYIQAISPEKMKEFFEAVMNADPVIANEMKPMYVEWLVLNEGIEAARAVYKKVCLEPPFCKELHTKMAELETMQLNIVPKYCRYPHQIATKQFGKNDTDVWMNYIMFELKYGDVKNASFIYNEAIKTLNKPLISEMVKKYSLMQINSDVDMLDNSI